MHAVALEEYPEGQEQIATLFGTVNRPAMQELAAHVRSRQIMVDYYIALSSGDDPMRAFSKWLEDLEYLVTVFARTEAGLEGMMQLASFKEMTDPANTESIRWYERVIEAVPGQPMANRARGAIRRLTAEGKEIPFQARDTADRTFDIAEHRGQYVLLFFWDTHSVMQLPIINAVTGRFASTELATIGVNLDVDEQTLRASLQNAGVNWRQLHAPGGLDGVLAMYWGIMTPPYMILYDRESKVIRSNILTVEDLQQTLAELLL
jgi:hypothetical protein